MGQTSRGRPASERRGERRPGRAGRPGPASGSFRDQGASRAGERAARRDPGGPPAPGYAAAVIAGPGRGPGYRPQHGRRGLQPAGRGGLADRADRVGDVRRAAPGGRARRGGRGPSRGGGTPVRPAGRRARPVRVPAPGLARDGPQGPRGRPRSPAGLSGPARAPAAAGGSGGLPGPGPGGDRRSGAHRHLRRLRARPGRHQPRAALGRREHPRRGGLRPPGPPRHRRRAGPAPAAAARRRHGRRHRPRPPGRTRCC